jgi:hypothetical protein
MILDGCPNPVKGFGGNAVPPMVSPTAGQCLKKDSPTLSEPFLNHGDTAALTVQP